MAQTSAGPRWGRRLRYALIGLAGAIVIVVAAVAIFLATFDPSSLKPRIVAAVKQATGRELALNGAIRLAPSLQPTIEVSDVAFANPPGFSRPQMATLQRLDLRLALLPLLSKRVEVEQLVLVGPDIRLETNAKGVANWQIEPPGPAAPATAAPTSPPASGAPPVGILLKEVRIQDGTLAYRDSTTGRTFNLAIKALTATKSAGAELHATADASANGVPLTLAAAVGPLQGSGPMALDATLKAAGASLATKGSIADPAAAAGVNIAIAVQVPDLSALSPLAQSDLPALKQIAFQATLTDPNHGLANGAGLQDLKLTTPAGDLAGTVSAAPGAPPTVTADLKSDRLDIDTLLASAGKPAAPPAGQAAAPAAASPPSPARLFSDQPVPFAALKAVNADVTLAIAALTAGGTAIKAASAHAVLKDGTLRLDPLAADLPGGRLNATLTAADAAPTPQVSLTAHAPGLALAPLLAALKEPPYVSGNLEIDANLKGAGGSPHAIAASLDGALGLAVPTGTIDSRLIGGILGNALDKINGLASLSRVGSGQLRCFAARLDLSRGQGTVKALELSSSLLSMTGTGSIDLGAETLDLHLRAVAQAAVTSIVVPVRVTGSLLSPHSDLDAVGAAASNAGSIAEAVITRATPLGIVGGMLGADKALGLTAGDPCPAALAIARGQAAPAAPAAAAPTQPGSNAPQLGNQQRSLQPQQLGNQLKSLFR